jgi:hypothetical protein
VNDTRALAPRRVLGPDSAPLAPRVSLDLGDEDRVFATRGDTAHQPSNLMGREFTPAARRGLGGRHGQALARLHTLRQSTLPGGGRTQSGCASFSATMIPGFTLRTYIHLAPSDLPDLDLALVEPNRAPTPTTLTRSQGRVQPAEAAPLTAQPRASRE